VEQTETQQWHALSIKQPWAALIVAGKKTIEVRTWKTTFRGPVLIHAGRVPDSRPEAWKWVDTDEISRLANYQGGIIGKAVVNNCRLYQTPEQFQQDRMLHLNENEWFRPPVLYGFELQNVSPLPFQVLKGQTLFFSVKGFVLQ
jgi:hypothetical protein